QIKSTFLVISRSRVRLLVPAPYKVSKVVFAAFEISEKPAFWRNAVHLSGATLRLTGYRVFDIFTALGLAGLGR
ncbi:hypothetical protein A233_24936, partial [Pseudomonas syringae pv. actinidiae ICMP 19097]